MASVNCCDVSGSCDASVAGEPICQEDFVDVDFVDDLPHVDKTFKKTHKRDESRISKISRLSIRSLKGFDGVDGASEAGNEKNSPLLGYVVSKKMNQIYK